MMFFVGTDHYIEQIVILYELTLFSVVDLEITGFYRTFRSIELITKKKDHEETGWKEN